MTATDQSGLADSTTYYFKVNSVEYDITTSVSPTYQDVANLMDTALDSAGFSAVIVGTAPDQQIRIRNVGVRGLGSVCILTQGTTSPDLFSNLNFWSRFRIPPVNTRNTLDIIATVQDGGPQLSGAIFIPPFVYLDGAPGVTQHYINPGSAAINSLVYAIKFGNKIVFSSTRGSIAFFDWDTSLLRKFDSNVPPTSRAEEFGYFNLASMIQFGSYLVVTVFAKGIASFDGTNWKWWDGSGSGTGPYAIYSTMFTTGTGVAYLTTYGSYLIVCNNASGLASWDGANWKKDDGSGSGTGPYSVSVLGNSYPRVSVTFNGNLVLSTAVSYARVSSWDGANWKYYDGSGTGTGPYYDNLTQNNLALGIFNSKLYLGANNGLVYEWVSGNDWTGLAIAPLSTAIFYMIEYNSQLVMVHNPAYISSYDGTNFKWFDGSGSGTGIYYGSTLGTSTPFLLFSFGSTLAVIGSVNNMPALSTYDGFNWKKYDGTGTGTGYYFTGPTDASTLSRIGQTVTSFAATNSRIHTTSSSYHNYYNLETNAWGLSSAENLAIVLGGSNALAQRCGYKKYYMFANALGLSSHDGSAWKKYDGTGSGTGPYASLAALGGGTAVRFVTIYNDYLIAVASNSNLSSFDGTNWKYYDGSGIGTGPYSSGVMTTSATIFLSLTDGSNWMFASSFHVNSFDGTNWKYYDGTGSGTGPYDNNSILGSSVIVRCITKYGIYYIFAGDSGRLASWDPPNGWKKYDGSGSGTGPYNNITVLGTDAISFAIALGSMLIVASTNGRVGSWDGSNWKNYDGTGTGTGPYSSGIFDISFTISKVLNVNNNILFLGYGGRVASWDGSNWKNYDGTGNGTGPYNGGASVGGYRIIDAYYLNTMLYIFANNERLASYKPSTNTWATYDNRNSTERIPPIRTGLSEYSVPS